MSLSVLVSGSSGRTGKKIVSALSNSGARVISFIRDPSKEKEMIKLGSSSVVIGNMLDRQTINKALFNVDIILHIGPPMHPDEKVITKNFIDEAKKRRVAKFIYYSVMHPLRRSVRHHSLKLDCEEMLIESGIPYSIIQPIRYMQHVNLNFLVHTDSSSVLSMPFDVEKKFNIVDLSDVAEATAHIALEDSWLYGTFELAGPEALSQIDMSEIISEIIDEKELNFPNGVIAKRLRIDELKLKSQKAGIPDDKINQMINMNNHYDKYGFLGNSKVLEMVLGRKPNTFKEYFCKLLESIKE